MIAPDQKQSVLILLSGGLDSAACVAFYKAQGYQIEAIFFDYNQLALINERRAARLVAKHFGIKLQIVKLKGHIPKKVGGVRARNAVFMLAALMEHPIRKGLIAIGIHAGSPYYDSTPAFITGVQVLFDGYTNGMVRAAAPFIKMHKGDISQYSRDAKLPIEITYSCERGGKKQCGRCASCRDTRKLHALQNH